MLRKLHAALARLPRDENGSLTIEFVLWVPFLAFWMAFSAAVFNAYMTRNQTAKAAHTVSDIVSRKDRMNGAAFDELYALQHRLLPLAREGHDLRITSIELVRIDPESEVHEYDVAWSYASPGLEPLTAGDFPFARLPVMAETDSVVYTEVVVPWTPFTAVPGLTGHSWTFGIASRPRFVPSIESTDESADETTAEGTGG